MKNDFINRIVALEWDMFKTVYSLGGRAACQDNSKIFNIMRSAQMNAWSEDALESYLDDLLDAERQGRNLLTEKYARMMEFTDPEEYARLEHMLPAIDPDNMFLIDKITEIHMAWTKEVTEKFPYVRQNGRPAATESDTNYITSVETYLRGELATYSGKTLALYYQNLVAQKEANINGAQIVLEFMVKKHGYTSLEDANEKLSRRN